MSKRKRKLPALKSRWESLYYYDFEAASNDELLALQDKAYALFYKLIPKSAERLLGDFEELIIELEKRSNR
jgi:hypothetical protein